jgi:SagB-type dehydrogenase family enzyme
MTTTNAKTRTGTTVVHPAPGPIPGGYRNSAPWLPLLVMRPVTATGRLELSDPVQHRRATMAADDVLDLVAPGPDPSNPRREAVAGELRDRGWLPGAPIEDGRLTALRRWWTRGWHPSLSYYLWSRHHTYRDYTDSDGGVRRETLARYLRTAPPPRRRQIDGRLIPLPPAGPVPQGSVGALLMRRRSVRAYAPIPVDLPQLSGVLAHGLDDLRAIRQVPKEEPLNWLRSHGTPFDFYVVNHAVEGLAPGVYAYDLAAHGLRAVRLGDLRARMAAILIGMRAPETAAWTLVVAADFAQYQWRYRHERALRHLYMGVGRVAQRLIVVGHAFGLGSMCTPAACDLDACDLLGLDPDRQAPVYTLTMGPLRPDAER